MQRKILITTAGILLVLLFIGLFPVHGEEKLYKSVIRLHVLANSDSEEDQALKLQVRDAVLAVTTPLMENCSTREDAVRCIEENTPAILLAAQSVVREAGRDDLVTITLGEEEYPERDYDSFCFPAGTYLSLRIGIGNAEGKNWWCCLFPRLCLGNVAVSQTRAENAFVSVGMTPAQYKIITETDKPVYRARFRILELFQSVF